MRVKRVQRKLTTAKKVVQTYGLGEVCTLLIRKIVKPSNGRELPQDLQVLEDSLITANLSNALGIELRDLEKAEVEFQTLSCMGSTAASRARRSFFGPEYDAGPNLTKVLFLLCRVLRPALVVETGVASGISSRAILGALEINKAGRLLSIDITKNVGESIEDHLRNRWTLKILPTRFRKREFSRLVKQTTGLDIFVHDSDHRQVWQEFEFLTLAQNSPSTKVFVFDDVSAGVIEQAKLTFPEVRIFLIKEEDKTAALFIR